MLVQSVGTKCTLFTWKEVQSCPYDEQGEKFYRLITITASGHVMAVIGTSCFVIVWLRILHVAVLIDNHIFTVTGMS